MAKSALPSHYARRDTAYPPFPANDKLQPDLGIMLWPELRRVTLLVPHSGNLPILPGRYKQARATNKGEF
jgi:hypothetical protein